MAENQEAAWKRYYKSHKDEHNKKTREYSDKYMRTIGVKFHKESDWDVLYRLDNIEKGGKVDYIRQLIRDDIKRTGFQVPPSPKELEAQEREAERLAEVEKYHRIKAEMAEANGSDGKPVQSGDSEAEARKLFGM